jgi:hypothetical protein
MEEIKISWQLISVIGGFCGVIAAMVKWYGGRIHDLLDKLVDTVNEHSAVIKVESKRNDDQDETLDKHERDISSLKERVWEVRYKKA